MMKEWLTTSIREVLLCSRAVTALAKSELQPNKGKSSLMCTYVCQLINSQTLLNNLSALDLLNLIPDIERERASNVRYDESFRRR